MRNLVVGFAIVGLLAVGLHAQDASQSASMRDGGEHAQARTVALQRYAAIRN